MDLKMHFYSVPLRSPFAIPCVPWNFEVGERLWPEIRGGGTAFPRVLLHFNHCLRAYGTPILGRGGRRGSAMAPFERAMVVSYRISIVTVALSVTIRPHVSDAQINRGSVTLGQNFRVFPFE